MGSISSSIEAVNGYWDTFQSIRVLYNVVCYHKRHLSSSGLLLRGLQLSVQTSVCPDQTCFCSCLALCKSTCELLFSNVSFVPGLLASNESVDPHTESVDVGTLGSWWVSRCWNSWFLVKQSSLDFSSWPCLLPFNKWILDICFRNTQQI